MRSEASPKPYRDPSTPKSAGEIARERSDAWHRAIAGQGPCAECGGFFWFGTVRRGSDGRWHCKTHFS